MGTNAVQGDGGHQGLTQIGAKAAHGRRGYPAAHPVRPARALSVRLALWDERPWTDLPARLTALEGLCLWEEGPDTRRADGLLIIRRWPTPMVLRRLAETVAASPIPIIFCTAAPSEACAAVLRLGIADILRHEMHNAEVMARLALRCGAGQGPESAQMAFGPLLLDRMQRMAWLHGRMVCLTPLQFDLLAALMQGALMTGGPLSAQTLRKAAWHSDRDPGTNRLAVHMHHIRRAIQDAGGGVRVRAIGSGYALILEQPA